jgi:hypothetical protein
MIIDDIFSPIYGKFCWDAEKGYGSFLTFEFGEPHLYVWERHRSKEGMLELRRSGAVHGDWHLWIYMCDWKIHSHEKLIADSQSPKRKLDRAMGRLHGQVLTRVDVQLDYRTTFQFELGDQLETIPNIAEYGQKSEQWLLYEHLGKVFTLRADQMYSYQPGDTPRDEERWVPFNP